MGDTTTAQAAATDPKVVAYLAKHPGPLVAADAVARTVHGQVLIVNPNYKAGWDLPGGMNDDEDPREGLLRELREELGVSGMPLGRLLAIDTTPAHVYGRTLITFIYSCALPGTVRTIADLQLQEAEITEAAFVSDEVALGRFPERMERRVRAALDAERHGRIVDLHDGHPSAGKFQLPPTYLGGRP